MSDTNDMRREFEVLLVGRGASTTHKGEGYGDSLSQSFWVFWQIATERATAAKDTEIASLKKSGPCIVRGTDGYGKPFMGTMEQVLQDYRSAADAEAREVDRLNAKIVSLRKELGNAIRQGGEV